METARYIMSIFRVKTMIVLSWGFHNPKAVESGLLFNVQGFKFRGTVKVEYDEGTDLFNITFFKGNKAVEATKGVYVDMLVDVIDIFVEKTDDYEDRVNEEYSLSV